MPHLSWTRNHWMGLLGGTIALGVAIGYGRSSIPSPPRPIRIMPLGDSITQGNTQHNSYRRPLWQRLKQAGYDVDFVGSQREQLGGGPPPNPDFDLDHEGHWGWPASDVLKRIDGWAASAKPDIVLLHLASNDLSSRQTAAVVGSLRSIIERLRRVNPKVTVLLAQIIPCGGTLEQIQALNQQIGQLGPQISTAQSPVVIVDQFRGFNGTPGKDTYDGCHPNLSGERKLSDRWFEALVKVLPKP